MDSITITVIVIISTITIIEAVNVFFTLPHHYCSYGFTAVIVMNKEDDVEVKMESVIHKIRWTDDELINKVIIINNCMNDVQYDICRKYCYENNFLEMAEPDEVINLIFSNEK